MAVDPSRLGLEVRQEREAQGISQAELARRAGSHQAVISKIEKGDHELQFDLLGRIAEALFGDNGLAVLLVRSGHISLDLPVREVIASAPELTPESRDYLVKGYERAVRFDSEEGFVSPRRPSQP